MVTIDLGPEYPEAVTFSSEANGSLVESVVTDETGKAVLRVRDGGMVSFSTQTGELITFLSVDAESDLVWHEESRPVLGTQSLSVSIPEIIDGDLYSVYACRDRAFERSAPAVVDLRIDDDCLAGPAIPVMAFATDSTGGMTYAQATVDSKKVDSTTLELTWQNDFQDVPITFKYPGLTEQTRTAQIAAGPSIEVHFPQTQVRG